MCSGEKMSTKKRRRPIPPNKKSFPIPLLIALIVGGSLFSCCICGGVVSIFNQTDIEQGQELDKQKTDNLAKKKEPSKTKIVCDKFNLVAKLTGSTLNLSIETDLPDYSVVSVTVSRKYSEKGNPNKHSVEYFSEKSTIEKWKSKHKISIDDKKWISDLRARQKHDAEFGEGFDVEYVSDKISIYVVVPTNQPNPNFGLRNKNLVGKAVSKDDVLGTIKNEDDFFRTVKSEVEFDSLLKDPPTGKSPYPNLVNSRKLKVGQTYVLSKQTPLMPSHDPVDPIEAVRQMKQIPPGAKMKVLDLVMKNGKPWYQVDVYNPKKTGTGWINSTALWYNATVDQDDSKTAKKSNGSQKEKMVINTTLSRWHNDTYKVTVRQVSDKVWEEVQDATGKAVWRYSETTRTKDSVELYCPKRKYQIRLLTKRMELKKDGKWTWVANGHWKTPLNAQSKK